MLKGTYVRYIPITDINKNINVYKNVTLYKNIKSDKKLI